MQWFKNSSTNNHEQSGMQGKLPWNVSDCSFRNMFSTISKPCGSIDISICPDYHLLAVVQNNVLRGLLSNIMSLGLTLRFISEDDSQSLFYTKPANSPIPFISLPPSLLPTVAQFTIPHHPWIDLLPCPRLRDSIIFACQEMTELAETQLCEDMAGAGQLQMNGDGPGLVVWGDAHLISSWEVSQPLLNKWKKIFIGCDQLIQSSNNWRASRNEVPLKI